MLLNTVLFNYRTYSALLTKLLNLSETCRPLTKSAIALLFGRLRKRARITSKHVSPSLLRETFAVRYLQAEGDPCVLQELLGHTDQATSTRVLSCSRSTNAMWL